ncbi:MAG: peptidoglycan-binding protein [Candidatus Sungbacteria bacterium]|uniref:Peptidoglycan-binding protein n=1 Tax=Candidatus Sungiibacteriota bacterium TaxID=2750080 RepID=A0A9D6LNS6_9BACT|nr:peptidoglycan-binding protein [Candidatus Sungbacteria bacterium]
MKKFYLLLLFTIFGVLPAVASADNPAVTSFSATPSSISYGQFTALSWAITNGSGHNLYFFCNQGISLKTDAGAAFPCNTKQSVSSYASDSAGFQIINATGATQSVTVRVTPKDASGADYDAGGVSTTITVGPIPHPISNFSASTQYPIPGTALTLTWTGIDIGGANLQFDCVSGIQVFSQSPSVTNALPCNGLAYTSDLAGSGSVTISFSNASYSSATLGVRVLPAIVPGVYDGTHGISLSLTVGGALPPQSESIFSFTSSKTIALSGEPIYFSWDARNASGTNIQLPCSDAVTATSSLWDPVIALHCVGLALPQPLSVTGSSTIAFSNHTGIPQTVSFMLLPESLTGTYDPLKSKTIVLTILPPGSSPSSAVSSTTSQASGAAGAGTASQGSIKVVHTIPFTLYLSKGSSNKQVTALQQLLRQDPTLYPEKTVSGYYGPATQAAVIRFQARYGIAKKGDTGYGSVGVKTRAKLNGLKDF